MEHIELIPGNEFLYQGSRVRLKMLIDLHEVIVEYVLTGEKARVPVYLLRVSSTRGEEISKVLEDDFISLSDAEWEKAQQKLRMIAPILSSPGNLSIVEEVSERTGVSQATLYRWVKSYKDAGSVTALVEKKRGGEGQTRLSDELELLIEKSIDMHYMSNQKKRAVKVYLDVKQQCSVLNLAAPGYNTIRRRLQRLAESEVAKRRLGSKAARELFSPIIKSFPDADYPLSVVQIDHTIVDIILVDELYRKVIGRPWLTLAIDVFSRCVVGFYLSFDPPGAIGTGLCISQMILPKETYLAKLNVQGEWPCWGVPDVLHLDNAREFKGIMIKKACEKYGIQIKWRPVATPHWGGHIERLIGTFMSEVHNLKGTTFSNFRMKQNYDSEKNATLTLPELERWLTHLIVQVYHQKMHSGIDTSPSDKYKSGILGTKMHPGRGVPGRLIDEQQVRLDFMPLEERTVQDYGVLIDHIYYYNDVLRQYINVVDRGSGKAKLKSKFVFRRDPRDISCIYFLDPGSGQYHRIPYRDTSRPSMSIWEHREIIKRLKDQGREKIDEQAIFEGYENMRKIELEAIHQKKKISKNKNRMIQGLVSQGSRIGTSNNLIEHFDQASISATIDYKSTARNVSPFDGLDDE